MSTNSEEVTNFASLLPTSKVTRLIDQWLDEDWTAFDVAGCVAGGDRVVTARLFCKQQGKVILAGVPFFDGVFDRMGCAVDWLTDCVEGKVLPNSDQFSKRHIGTVSGPVAGVLRGERVALNCMSRSCGLATSVREIVDIVREEEWQGRIACTRKTTPGFRLVEKYAVLCGGGDPHRYDLGSSMVMLKDNHIDACHGNIGKAISMAKQLASFTTKIEVEARNQDEAIRAVENGADIVMLDNFEPETAISVAHILKSKYPNVLVEVSGGIDPNNIKAYLDGNVDVISMGCLTQGYSCVDFSLKITKEH